MLSPSFTFLTLSFLYGLLAYFFIDNSIMDFFSKDQDISSRLLTAIPLYLHTFLFDLGVLVFLITIFAIILTGGSTVYANFYYFFWLDEFYLPIMILASLFDATLCSLCYSFGNIFRFHEGDYHYGRDPFFLLFFIPSIPYNVFNLYSYVKQKLDPLSSKDLDNRDLLDCSNSDSEYEESAPYLEEFNPYSESFLNSGNHN